MNNWEVCCLNKTSKQQESIDSLKFSIHCRYRYLQTMGRIYIF